MTSGSNFNQSYPGFHGVVDVVSSDDLVPSERRRLRDDVQTIIEGAEDPNAFFADIVWEVRALRCMQTLDYERTNKARLAEAKAAIDALDRGEPMPRLSQIGLNHMAYVREQMPNVCDRARLTTLKSALPKVGSRRPPDDSLVLSAVALARIFSANVPGTPTSEKERPFVILLQAVAKAAGRKSCTALHGVAEEALRIELEAYSPGVTIHGRSERRTSF
ncbi:hypothetical protein [Sphingomonas prati]|uniref:Uncharacterized protein n=1 Tax=Sphingomonas prati TaxID=1843237 RepID=A0A7W9BQL2_9SPHN|nr:hypothetical protein [Sphingomonas prati]MBB5728323.1 hypothetical protein [Sphingomonas prati]GGE74693.1 hypothetical protein GCM10011404_04030 [Sphingomonas prati]